MADDFFDSPPQSSGTYTLSTGGGGGASSESQSTSHPVSVTSPQTDWGLLQAQYLSMLGDKVFQWAQDQYAKGMGVTDQTVQNFLQMSGYGKGLADTLLSQYKDRVAPAMEQYFREAGSYASEERQRYEAGKAMSTQAQSNTAAINELERKLQGFDVNPNSGRYQSLLMSNRTADAAARAGAGTMAAERTAETGRGMLEKYIGWGQQLPGQAMGAVQSAYAGLTGAENAILGMLNTGATLQKVPPAYYDAANAANKVPPTGQEAQSTASSQSPAPQGGGKGGGGGSKGGGGGGQQQAQPRPTHSQRAVAARLPSAAWGSRTYRPPHYPTATRKMTGPAPRKI
jgi:hypothetical protein